jgi:putative hydrolase of the HAD superfamily
MDDTLLDYMSHVDASWRLVCAEFSGEHGCDSNQLREVIREESTAFWRDEESAGHWRVKLDEAREVVVTTALGRLGLDAQHAAAVAMAYRREVESRLALFEDTVETLAALRQAGLLLGIITNGPQEGQRWKINRFELAPLVDHIVIEGEFGRGKPDPAVFTHAVETLGVEPGEAWMVGDNLYADIRGAQSVGIHAAWIHRERLKLPENPPARPDRTVATLHEIRDAVLG